ncbi:hypothetical protein BH20ACT5_BH20ACT5_04020 [soil metagenome]
MTRVRQCLVSAMAVFAVSVGLAVPVHAASAVAEPVTRVMVWGDSMSLAWPQDLGLLLPVPVQPKGAGAETVQQTQDRFNAWVDANEKTQQFKTTGHLCWCGHVNFNRFNYESANQHPGTIVLTLEAMAKRVPRGLFMPIGLTNSPLEPEGSVKYDRLMGINADMAASEHLVSGYADVRGYLVTDGLSVAGITPTAEDEASMRVDVPPPSLRRMKNPADAHLNDAGRRVTAVRLDALIRAEGWLGAAEARSATGTALESSANPSVEGKAFRVQAVVSPVQAGLATPTGTIQFYAADRPVGPPVTLVNGIALSGPIRTLTAGDHTIVGFYTGDATNAPSMTQFTQVVTSTG